MFMSTLRVLTADHIPTSKHYAKSCVNTTCLLHTREYKVLKVPRPSLSLHLAVNWVEEVFVSFRMSSLGKRKRERKGRGSIISNSSLTYLFYIICIGTWILNARYWFLLHTSKRIKDLVHWWLNSRNLQPRAITFKTMTDSFCLSFSQNPALAIMDN